MEREEGAAKVGAGETAVCSDCGRPFAQALGETATCQCSGGLQDNCTDDVEKRKEGAKWFAETYLRIRALDQAKFEEFNSRLNALIEKSSLETIQAERSLAVERLEFLDLSSNHSHIAIVRSYDAAMHTCKVEIPGRTHWIEADIEYPQKSDHPILKAGMKVCLRFFPTIEGYVVPD